MIKAQHTKIGDFIFRNYLTFLFRKHFYKIHLLGDIPQFDTSLPLILLPNHSTWWDGFFIYFLNKTILKRQAYLMMLEEQLAKNLFFKYIGAYSIDSASPSQIKESITYTLSLIDRNVDLATMVCIFPQGELLPWGARPLGYKRGVELVLKKINRSVNLYP